MNTTVLKAVCALTCSLTLLASPCLQAGSNQASIKKTTIENPDYEFRKSAVIGITGIERNDTATRMNFHAQFRPRYWISIDSTASIVDPATGIIHHPVTTEGIPMNEHFWMPDSGEVDFTVVWPPLPDDVHSINFIDGSWSIYGLRLDGRKVPAKSSVDPDKWLAANDRPYPGAPAKFFNTGTCHLSGVINGYNPMLGFDNILLYMPSSLTGQSNPVSVDINADGSFEADLPMTAPGFAQIDVNNIHTSIYLEPDRSLNILLDWEDMLKYELDRICDRPCNLKKVYFAGELGAVNRDIHGAPTPEHPWIGDIYKTMTPSQATAEIMKWDADFGAKLDAYCAKPGLNPHAVKLLGINRRMLNAGHLLDYDMYRSDIAHTDSLAPSLKEPVTLGYFDFMKAIYADTDPWILAAEGINLILNRTAFSSFFDSAGIKDHFRITVIGDNGLLFLKDKCASLTPEEEETARRITENTGKELLLTLEELNSMFFNVNIDSAAIRCGMADELRHFRDSVGPFIKMENAWAFNACAKARYIKDFASTDDTPLLWQAVTSCYLCSWSSIKPEYQPRDSMFKEIEAISDSGAVTHPDIIATIKEHFTALYGAQPWELPSDERGKLIRNIIAPYRGKFILLDFWGTGCGPCRYNIEHSAEIRAANREHPDFKMIFITGDSESPEDAYNKYVADNLAGETSLRVSASDFIRMRDLFCFSGIPHYVLIDREGKVIENGFSYHSLRERLAKLSVTLK